MQKSEQYAQHRDMVKENITSQRIVLNGETLEQNSVTTFKDSLPANIFMLFNSKDEREPHYFMERDPIVQQGMVKDWHIKELDLVHAERDDELVLR